MKATSEDTRIETNRIIEINKCSVACVSRIRKKRLKDELDAFCCLVRISASATTFDKIGFNARVRRASSAREFGARVRTTVNSGKEKEQFSDTFPFIRL